MKQTVQQNPEYLMTSDRESNRFEVPAFDLTVSLEPIITANISATVHEKCEAFEDDPAWELIEPFIEESLAQVRAGKVITHEEFRARINAKYFQNPTK